MSLLEELTSKGKFLANIYRAYINRGFSFNSVQKVLMEAGLSYRRSEMLNDWNVIKASVSAWKENLPSDPSVPIPESFYTEADIKGPEQFYTKVKATVINQNTGMEEDRWITIKHDALITQEEINDRLDEILSKGEEEGSSPVELQDFMVIEGYKRRY